MGKQSDNTLNVIKKSILFSSVKETLKPSGGKNTSGTFAWNRINRLNRCIWLQFNKIELIFLQIGISRWIILDSKTYNKILWLSIIDLTVSGASECFARLYFKFIVEFELLRRA